MFKFEKIDWVTFSWDGTFGDVAHIEDLFRKIGVNLIKRGGNMFYRFALVGEGVFLAYQNRMRNNRFFQVELSGKFFFSRGREEWACEFIRMFKGYPSRIDVAWDFFPEDLLDVQDVELLQKIDSKYPMKHHRHIVNGVDTGFSLGMGKGSEVSLRMYDKLTEQKALGKTEVEVNGCNEWWRVEIQVCGNTLKDQGVKWTEIDVDQVYNLGRGFYRSRFTDPLGIGIDRDIQPRKAGSGGLGGKLLYWQRKRDIAQRRLEEISMEVENA